MDFGSIKMPQNPLVNKYGREEQEQTYNVLVVSLKYGSSMLKLNSIAFDLSQYKWPDTGLPMFNITLFTETDSIMKSKVSDTFHILEWNYNSKLMNTKKGIDISYLIFHENRLMDDLFRRQNTDFVRILNESNFHGALGQFYPYENLICKSIGLPFLQYGSYLSEPLMSIMSKRPLWDESQNMPAFHPSGSLLKATGHQHIMNRMVNIGVQRFCDYVFWITCYPRWRFWNDSKDKTDLLETVLQDMIIGEAYWGIREKKQEQQRTRSIIPFTRKASMYQKGKSMLELTDEYQEFLDKYDQGTILVAFGNTWQPKKKRYTELIETFKQMPHIGFVVSLKDFWASYQAIKEEDLPNVLLKTFVPQIELLNDKRVFAFLSHGGANSIQEALYYGKPLIGMPLAWDQYGTSYRFEQLGVGVSLGDNPKATQIVEEINGLLPKNEQKSKMKQKVEDVQKIIHFQELRSGQDTAAQVRKSIVYHKWSGGKSSKHIAEGSPTNIHIDLWLHVTDLDIKLEFTFWFLLVFFILKFIFTKSLQLVGLVSTSAPKPKAKKEKND